MLLVVLAFASNINSLNLIQLKYLLILSNGVRFFIEFCIWQRSIRDLGIAARYEYYWCDGVHYKKPTKLPAMQYIELLMEWVEVQINNEELFPQNVGELVKPCDS